MSHVPVLLKEVIELLDPKSGETFIDGTLGDGGHAVEIIKKIGGKGRFLGIDLDDQAIKTAESRIKDQKLEIKQLILVKDNFANLKNITEENNFKTIDGILLDLGLRSAELEESGRGFSFLRDEPLDMRFNPSSDMRTVAELINSLAEDELVDIFRKFGEEKFSKDIAREILIVRKNKELRTTRELRDLILSVYRRRLHSKKEIPWIGGIHPATKAFQALRIAVNHELENLKNVLPAAIDLLAPGGRIGVISFHSLEDRIVKHFFRERDDIEIVTKKPVIAGDDEVKTNPRSRSAKLRAARKLGNSFIVG